MEKVFLVLLLAAVSSQADDWQINANWTHVCDWNTYCSCDKMDGTTNNRELLGTKIPLATCKELCLEDSSCNGIEFWYRSFDCFKCIDPSRHYPHEFKSWREPNPIVVEKGSSGYEGIRLADGTNQYEGRLEILFRGEWGTVCSDRFQLEDAQVACKMLGTGTAIGFVNEHYWPNFGPGNWSSKVLLSSLMCNGEESNLFDCEHSGVGGVEPWCDHNKDVGLVCEQPCYDVDAAFKGAAVFEPGTGMDNVFYDVKSAYDCQKECQRWAGCEYFTWNSGTGPGRWNKKNANTCWLKREKVKVMRRNKDSGKISGPREC